MKKPIPPIVIGIAAVVALVAVVFFFIKGTTVEPTVTNLPDYSKMSGAEIAKQKEASMDAEKNAKRPGP